MIYADSSFLCSLYGWDDNTRPANATYASDRRRPLPFTAWQRLEVRNGLRLAVRRFHRTRQTVPFQIGNVFRRIESDIARGILRHVEPDWYEAFRRAEELSARHSINLGAAAVDLWHVAIAHLLGADTFWTFDAEQRALADASGHFDHVPKLTA